MAKVDVRTCINEDAQIVIRVGGPEQAVAMEPIAITRHESLGFAAVIVLHRLRDGSLSNNETLEAFAARLTGQPV